MAGIPYDNIAMQQGLVRVLTKAVGDQLGFLVDPSGSVTDQRAIYLDTQDIPEPQLPFIEISYLQDNDNDGWLLDSGTVETEDPDDPPNTVIVPYFDNYLNISVMLKCEGTGASNILRTIKKKFLSESYRLFLKEETNCAIQLINVNGRSPQFIDTIFREQNTMLLTFNTVDRYLDFDAASIYNQVISEGELYKDKDQTDTPIKVDTDVGPVTP